MNKPSSFKILNFQYRSVILFLIGVLEISSSKPSEQKFVTGHFFQAMGHSLVSLA